MAPIKRVEQVIYVIRGHRVMLDRDLAAVYGVETRVLIQAVKRNFKRFPEDFLFQLSNEEMKNWISQIVMSNPSAKMGIRKPPYAFTEYGAVMAANILRSERAMLMSIEVVRAFIRLRQALIGQKEPVKEMADLKSFVLKHAQKSDQEFRRVWRAIEKLAPPPPTEQRRIGFDLSQ